ncbi:hypothetical protein PR202_ga08423 [Eleusine coracana subsp. coracana]|uniref:J domain-containing protein n=1 Tax=Eleusine coracana subsp. coracana TaxID=191504 RepID=A0AAV5C263_ELECO|nr:hypothetical protein PR202_ga08423 [Eleusine coracana subsp. coracana]
MLYVLEVLCAAGEAHPGRGVDWYRVLQVLPGDADARIEAQYRNIVAHVEPVAGDLPGAGSALRLVNEAYAVLSDPDKRARFNSRDKFAEFVISVGFDRPTVDNKAVDSRSKLNGLHTKDIRTLDVTNKAISNVQHTNNSCSDRRNSHLSNVANSSKTKTMDPGFHGDDVESQLASSSRVNRMDPCFHGDDGELLSPDKNPIDKKKRSDDRAIECFAVGQVWAAYDWDKFPRRYALITEKGEIWAIYSDWDIGWCSDSVMWKKSAFSVVEILTSYSKRIRIPSFRLTHEVGAMFELEHSAVPENRPDQNTLACAVPLTRLPGFHSDTNGSSEAAVSQFSNLSSSNMDLGAPQQGMIFSFIIYSIQRKFQTINNEKESSRGDAIMEHGGEEEDRWTESSKSSVSASSDTTVSSAASKQQALRLAEDLSMPSVECLSFDPILWRVQCRMEEGEGAAEAAITAKMRHQDYAGARTLLLETLQTNPWLESAVEMLYVLEVLCAAGEAHPGRGVDWYRVLQVLPGDADARIEAQYRNIVAHVEPVAGDLPGAGSALRLVNEAYAVLSDPDKRARFNSRDKFAEFVISVGFDRPTVDNKAVDSRGKLNGLHTKDIRTLDVTNKAITNVQHINNSCSDRRNSHLSNVASSSKPKTMDPGFSW